MALLIFCLLGYVAMGRLTYLLFKWIEGHLRREAPSEWTHKDLVATGIYWPGYLLAFVVVVVFSLLIAILKFIFMMFRKKSS